MLGASCPGSRAQCVACGVADPIKDACPYAKSYLADTEVNPNPNPNPTALLLSGGASRGAWGAGVIAHWKPACRPDFTVVTGVSSGALQATFAFLGRKNTCDDDLQNDDFTNDEKLKKLFTQRKTSDIYVWKSHFMVSNSLQSREPLRALIKQELTREVIQEVAGVQNRELWVGTVNLDTSQFCPWNMSEIARKAQAETIIQRKECFEDLFRDVIWASSGAPVLAPPVMIDVNACNTSGLPAVTAPHVDGGLRLRVFADPALSTARVNVPIAPSTNTKPKTQAYVIVNGQPPLHPTCVDDKLGPITIRALQILENEGIFGSLYYAQHALGSDWQLNYSAIPNDVCVDFDNSEFCQEKLEALFQKAEMWWSAQNPWQIDLPKPDPTPWPANCCSWMPKCPRNAPCAHPEICPP
jgi:predicted acylesterase/phospholipase RssA